MTESQVSNTTPTNPYQAAWDSYVQRFNTRHPEGLPGEEWGEESIWQFRFETLFIPYNIHLCQHACEIGAGAGKYTRKVLNASPARILCADISSQFLWVLTQNMAAEVACGRITPLLLQAQQADELWNQLVQQGLAGQLDFFYSIDTMVHIDFQLVLAYWITAALTLKPRGKLVMTLADPATERGKEKLLRDIKLYYHQQGLPGMRFAWMSKEMVTDMLEYLGFRVLRCDNPAPAGLKPRDMFVVAELADTEKPKLFATYIRQESQP